MPHIAISSGPNTGAEFPLADDIIKIGRGETETIQVLDQGVSREHSEIFRVGEMCFIRDLQSTNGTFVNDRRINEELLRNGDRIRIGTTVMVFKDPTGRQSTMDLTEVSQSISDDPGTTYEMLLRSEESAGSQSSVELPTMQTASPHLQWISEICAVLSSDTDLRTMCEEVLEKLKSDLQAEYGYIFLKVKRDGNLIPIGVKDASDERRISKTILKHVLENGRPLLTHDAGTDDRFARSESVVLKKIKSVICVPILIREMVWGVLYLHTESASRPFEESDLELAMIVGLQLGMAVDIHSARDRSTRNHFRAIRALMGAQELRDPSSTGHCERVANYSAAIATNMGLKPSDVQRVYMGALLHDIGKLALSDLPEGSGSETRVMRTRDPHVKLGIQILEPFEELQDILPIVEFHHEKTDGSGYPKGIRGDGIPLWARIVSVANEFDNMVTHGGSDAAGLPIKDALMELGRRAGVDLDSKVVESLLICHRNNTLYQAFAEASFGGLGQ